MGKVEGNSRNFLKNMFHILYENKLHFYTKIKFPIVKYSFNFYFLREKIED